MYMYKVDGFELNDIYSIPEEGVVNYYFDCPVKFLRDYINIEEILNDADNHRYYGEDFVIPRGEISIKVFDDDSIETGISAVVRDSDGNESAIDWTGIDLDDWFIDLLLMSVDEYEKENN